MAERSGWRRLARWSLAVPGGLALLVGALWLYGRSLPREHEATVTVELAAPPAAVWPRIADPVGSESWRAGVDRVHRIGERDGQPLFREESSFGALTFAQVETVPPRRLVVELVDSKTFGGRWIFVLEADAAGTRLTITEDGWIAPPLLRVLTRHVVGLDATLRRYADDLAAEVGREGA